MNSASFRTGTSSPQVLVLSVTEARGRICRRRPYGDDFASAGTLALRALHDASVPLPAGDGDFAVSSIDNSHSRAAGLAGYYGTLSVGASQVTLRDPHTKRARTVLRWKQLLQFHLAATSDVVDKDKICVLHTSRSVGFLDET